MGTRSLGAASAAACVLLVGCSSTAPGPPPATISTPATSVSRPPPRTTPRWQHVVVVVEENHNSSSIIGATDAPFLNQLARTGLSFTDMRGETHPSQPNYLALFSGSTQGVTDDSCPQTFTGPNLASQLLAHGDTFTGYSEKLPSAGYPGCDAYPYARRHVPWTDFSTVPASASQPLSAFPRDANALPDLAFVIPDVLHDMHDGTVAQADTWLHAHLGSYATWARTHHSLLVVTWDEDDDTAANHIATIAVGDGVAPGTWTQPADHYTLLSVLEDAFGLDRLGGAAHVAALPPLG